MASSESGADRTAPQGVLDHTERAEHVGTIDDPAKAEPGVGRTRAGRFVKGASGNPRGRPPKPKPSPDTLLTQILDEEVPNDNPGQSDCITIRETLARRLCLEALKDPRVAFALLKLEAANRASARTVIGGEADAQVAQDEEALHAYLARQARRMRRELEEDDT